MEGRPIVREANLEEFRQHPDFARREKLEEPKPEAPMYPNPLDRTKAAGLHQWGMVIDLNLNPCISESGGFIAATRKAKLKFVDVIGQGELDENPVDPGIAIESPDEAEQFLLRDGCRPLFCHRIEAHFLTGLTFGSNIRPG